MNQAVVRALFAALMFAFVLTSPAGAIDQGGMTRPAPVTNKKMGSSNMTKDDCSGLGGKIVAAVGICQTGQLCQMTGENGKDHAVCITKQ